MRKIKILFFLVILVIAPIFAKAGLFFGIADAFKDKARQLKLRQSKTGTPSALYPYCIAITNNGEYAYVGQEIELVTPQVGVIRLSDMVQIDTLSIIANHIEITHNDSYAYISHSNGVSIIRTSDHIETGLLLSGLSCGAIATTLDDTIVYISSSDSVYIFTTSDNALIDTISFEGGVRDIKIVDDTFVYIVATEYGDGHLYKIKISDNTIANSTSIEDYQEMDVTTGGETICIIHNASSNNVKLVRTSDLVTVDTLSIPGWPRALDITPSGNYVYVTTSTWSGPWPFPHPWWNDNLSIIRASNSTVVDNKSCEGAEPKDIAISPDGNTAYIANYRSYKISAISTGAYK